MQGAKRQGFRNHRYIGLVGSEYYTFSTKLVKLFRVQEIINPLLPRKKWLILVVIFINIYIVYKMHIITDIWIEMCSMESVDDKSTSDQLMAWCHHELIPPFTQGLQPLCLPCATTKLARSPLKAEGRPNGCLGRSRVAHRTFRHRHGRHGHREVLSMFKPVAQWSPRRSVAHRSLKGGSMKAHTSLWSQNGCTVVGHWLPSKKCEHCVSIWATRLPSLYHHCASFGWPMASIERSLWQPLCLHSATTATLEPPWQWFCLHSAFFARPVVALQQLWSFKEGTRVVLQQLHRNRTFWVPATTERPNHSYGRTKVARRSQPCVKGGLSHYPDPILTHIFGTIFATSGHQESSLIMLKSIPYCHCFLKYQTLPVLKTRLT